MVEGGVGDQLPTSKNAKIPKSHFQEWGWLVGDQLPTFDAEPKNANIPKSHFQGVGGW